MHINYLVIWNHLTNVLKLILHRDILIIKLILDHICIEIISLLLKLEFIKCERVLLCELRVGGNLVRRIAKPLLLLLSLEIVEL